MKFLGFLGDGFGVKEKKKVGTGGLCSTVTSKTSCVRVRVFLLRKQGRE